MGFKQTLALTLVLAIGIVFIASPSHAQDNGPFPLGQTITGTLSPTQPEQSWTFDAAAGTRVSIIARVAGGTPITLILMQSSGALLVSKNTDEEGVASVAQLYLEGGAYSVKLRGDFSVSAQTVGFELTVIPIGSQTLTPTPTLPADLTTPAPETEDPLLPSSRIEIGRDLQGAFTQDGQEHRYTFLGYAEDRITFGMSRLDATATFDPIIRLQAPNGDIIAENDNYGDSADALIINFQLPATGVYTLYVGGVNGVGTGGYRVAVGAGFTLRDVEHGLAPHNEPVLATIETYGVREVWLAEVTAGDSLSVSVEAWNNSSLDPMVEVVSPSGVTLGFDDDSGANSNAILVGIPAPETGLYRIHIAACNHTSIGTYRLWWQRDSAIPTPAPKTPAPAPIATTPSAATPTFDPARTVEATVIPATGTPAPPLGSGGSELIALSVNEIADRQIDLVVGQTLLLYVEGHWSFDPVLEVYTPDGYLLNRVDDVGEGSSYDINPRLNMPIEENGRYTVRVYGYEYTEGAFTLHWNVR